MVGDHERATVGRDVLDPVYVDPEPLLGKRSQRRQQETIGDLVVEAELVDLVVAGDAPAQEGQQPGELAIPGDVTEDLARGARDRLGDLVGVHRALVIDRQRRHRCHRLAASLTAFLAAVFLRTTFLASGPLGGSRLCR